MHQITSAQFKAAVELDPAWASKLTKPVKITDFCGMPESNITHLSPLLHFSGENEAGWCASFSDCKSLKIAEGKFAGFVNFSRSGIEKIGDLSCGKTNDGHSAAFFGCKSLKIAEGKFPGSVNFSESAIEEIRDLSCGKNNDGDSARFWKCQNLKVAEGHFEGSASFYNSSIETIGDLTCAINDRGIQLRVDNCPNLTKIPTTFNPHKIEADANLINKLKVARFIKKKREEIVEIEL